MGSSLDFSMILIHIEPFSLHISSQQLLGHLKGVLQTLDHQSPLQGGGSVWGGEGCPCYVFWNENYRFPQLAVLTRACLSPVRLVFFPSPRLVCKLLTSGICRFHNVALLLFCLQVFLQRKRQQFSQIHTNVKKSTTTACCSLQCKIKIVRGNISYIN